MLAKQGSLLSLGKGCDQTKQVFPGSRRQEASTTCPSRYPCHVITAGSIRKTLAGLQWRHMTLDAERRGAVTDTPQRMDQRCHHLTLQLPLGFFPLFSLADIWACCCSYLVVGSFAVGESVSQTARVLAQSSRYNPAGLCRMTSQSANGNSDLATTVNRPLAFPVCQTCLEGDTLSCRTCRCVFPGQALVLMSRGLWQEVAVLSLPWAVLTLLSLETASDTQPLYSSGFFLARVSIRLTAAVTTPCQSTQYTME